MAAACSSSLATAAAWRPDSRWVTWWSATCRMATSYCSTVSPHCIACPSWPTESGSCPGGEIPPPPPLLSTYHCHEVNNSSPPPPLTVFALSFSSGPPGLGGSFAESTIPLPLVHEGRLPKTLPAWFSGRGSSPTWSSLNSFPALPRPGGCTSPDISSAVLSRHLGSAPSMQLSNGQDV
jgi:hypothetical protein